MTDSKQVLFEHVIETAQHVPVKRRAQLYRALSEYTGNAEQTATLLEMAVDLEIADLKCRELAFQFGQHFQRQELGRAPKGGRK